MNDPDDLYIAVLKAEQKRRAATQERVRNHSKTYIAASKRSALIKIGRSIDPYKRIQGLRTANPDIELIAQSDKNHEREIHLLLDKYKINGEWYDVPKYKLNKVVRDYGFSKTRHFKTIIQ